MNEQARRIQRVYLVLVIGNTLAASFIWGINTLFLLDAGLSNLEAFAANAFFTAGMVVFEVRPESSRTRGAAGSRTCSARSRWPGRRSSTGRSG